MKTKILILLSLLFMNEAIAQNQKNDKIAIYQLFTRLFSNKNTTNKYYGNIEQNGSGKFNDINNEALQSLNRLGISHVWFTGVIEHATMTDYSNYGINKDNPLIVKGKAGSPYAIKDYYDVDPDLAVDVKNRMKEFDSLVKRTHANNLKVLIDFIPNHVARQYKSDNKPKGVSDFGETDDRNSSFDPENNFYYLPNQAFQVPDGINSPIENADQYKEVPAKATGNDVFSDKPSINDWYETIKLNYGVNYLKGGSRHFDPIPNTWLKMEDILSFWAKKGVDGFRCDMAEMVPVEFWAWVIPQIKAKFPNVIFIAEIYNPQQYSNYIFKGKFDYLYDKVGLYDTLRRLIEGQGNANDISKVWQNESGNFANHMLRFLENHDEQRIASDAFGKTPESAFAAMMLSATMHTGPIMIYFGQEWGVKPIKTEGFQGDDGRTSIFDYWGITEIQEWIKTFDERKIKNKKTWDFYEKMLHFAQDNEAVSNGEFYDLQYLNQNSLSFNSNKQYSYIRYTSNQKLLFVYNFDLVNSYKTVVNMPTDFLVGQFNFDPKKPLILEEYFEKSKDSKHKIESVKVTLKPNSFRIFNLKQ